MHMYMTIGFCSILIMTKIKNSKEISLDKEAFDAFKSLYGLAENRLSEYERHLGLLMQNQAYEKYRIMETSLERKFYEAYVIENDQWSIVYFVMMISDMKNG